MFINNTYHILLFEYWLCTITQSHDVRRFKHKFGVFWKIYIIFRLKQGIYELVVYHAILLNIIFLTVSILRSSLLVINLYFFVLDLLRVFILFHNNSLCRYFEVFLWTPNFPISFLRLILLLLFLEGHFIIGLLLKIK